MSPNFRPQHTASPCSSSSALAAVARAQLPTLAPAHGKGAHSPSGEDLACDPAGDEKVVLLGPPVPGHSQGGLNTCP